jgi:hypothetical protein
MIGRPYILELKIAQILPIHKDEERKQRYLNRHKKNENLE